MAPPLPTPPLLVVSFNGREYLGECLQSVVDQDYPAEQLDILLIDNASTDGSVEMVRERFPQVRIIENATNDGFAPVINQGARASSSEYLVLLNNDANAEPGWLRNLILPLLSDSRIKVTGGLLLDHTGTVVDYAGGQLAFYGQGFLPHRGDPPPGDLTRRPTIFASGASMAVPREWFLEVGGFDEDFFAFVEDVDFGWRTWVLGWECWFIPEAVAYHRHHGTIEKFGRPREQYLVERNALASLFKNFDDDNLARALPASLVLSLLRGFADPRSDIGDFRISPESAGTPPPTPEVSSLTGSHLAALRDFGLMLEDLRHKRAWIQEHRKRDDREVIRMFEASVAANTLDPQFTTVFSNVIDAFDMSWPDRPRQRVLILTADPLQARMAGPAIRVWEMARVLSAEHDVTVASTSLPQIESPDFRIAHLTDAGANKLFADADVIVIQGFMLHFFPQLMRSEAAIVVDVYDPFHIEALVQRKHDHPEERWSTMSSDADVVNDQLSRGDLLLCASEKQRDFWLGQLASLKRINPATYDQDANLAGLLAIAPFGLPAEPPVAKRRAIRDGVDGIGDDDVVLLWGGGIYNWFDPVTLIRGLAEVVADDPRVKLFFMGTQHPNPYVPEMARAVEARRVAEELGLLGTSVFFNDGWVSYAERADYLLDADIGVSTHFLHLETAFSFRTRMLDYLWAGLPILATEGDSFAQVVADHELGEVVPAEDPAAVAAAIRRLLDPAVRERAAANVAELAPTMTWAKALDPLVQFCRFPRRAPDLVTADPKYLVRRDPNRLTQRARTYYVRKFAAVLRDEGVGGAASRVATHIRFRLAQRALRR